MACCWIGVGVEYPSSFKAFNNGSMRLSCWNDKMIYLIILKKAHLLINILQEYIQKVVTKVIRKEV